MIANYDFDSIEQILVETLAYHGLPATTMHWWDKELMVSVILGDYYISIVLLVFMVNNFLHTGATWIRYHEQHDLF